MREEEEEGGGGGRRKGREEGEGRGEGGAKGKRGDTPTFNWGWGGHPGLDWAGRGIVGKPLKRGMQWCRNQAISFARTVLQAVLCQPLTPLAPLPPWEARGHTLPGVAQPRTLSYPTPHHHCPAGAGTRVMGVGRVGNAGVTGQRRKLGCCEGGRCHVRRACLGATPQPSTLGSVPAGPAWANVVHSTSLGHCPNQSHNRAGHPTIGPPPSSICAGQGQVGTPNPNDAPSPQLPSCTPHGSVRQCLQACLCLPLWLMAAMDAALRGAGQRM